ncbi:MAG: dienelactone hydrolase family protein [Ilumatobacteraceae bacterium]
MGATIELTAGDGHRLAAYESRPGSARAAVVIVQEIFGVNEHIRAVVDRYAGRGFHAIAPALFDRVERGVELGYNQDDGLRGREIRAGIDWDSTVLDVGAAVAHVAATGPVATIGYCWGGSVSWLAASELPIAAAVGYYGGQVTQFLDRTPLCPVLLHFGALDAMIPLDGVAKIGESYPDVEVHVYDGADHGFNCDARASYQPDAAALALERTLGFLARAGVDGG